MKARILLVFILVIVVISGCSPKNSAEPQQAQQQSKAEEKPQEPITLTMYEKGTGYFNEADFKTLIADPVKKKYPYITVKLVTGTLELPEYMASGQDFDLFATWNGKIAGYKDLGILEDLTPIAQKNKFDLSRFDQAAIDTVKTVSDTGELNALPTSNGLNALYYNKDIFDKFGVAYPRDGMTWEDTIELGKKLTRMDSGVQYSGLKLKSISSVISPLSLNVVDAKTDEALPNMDSYKKAFDISQQIYSISGNTFGNTEVQFTKDKTLAMNVNIGMFQALKDVQGLNWDIVQYPSYKDLPNISDMYNTNVIIPNKISKHQDEIMKVFEVFFSDEVQTVMVRKVGQPSVLKDPKYKQMFGMDIPELQGKNLQSLFKSKSATTPATSMYYVQATSILNSKYNDVMTNKKDINTALREAKEEIDKYIKSAKK